MSLFVCQLRAFFSQMKQKHVVCLPNCYCAVLVPLSEDHTYSSILKRFPTMSLYINNTEMYV